MDPALRTGIIACLRRFGPRPCIPGAPLPSRVSDIGSREFELFSAYYILNTRLDLGLGDQEVESAVTGGNDDSQIDAIALVVGGEPVLSEEDLHSALDAGIDESTDIRYVIIQATMHNDRQVEKIDKFSTGVANFFAAKAHLPISAQIKRWRRINDILFSHLRAKGISSKPRCSMFLAWQRRLAAVSEHAMGTLELRREDIVNRGLFREVTFEILGEGELLGLIQQAALRNEISLRVLDAMALPDEGADGAIRSSFVVRVRAKDLLTACEGPDSKLLPYLFYGNVRDYAGHKKGSVNAGIANSLEPQVRPQFIHRNNGAVVLAKSQKMIEGPDGRIFVLKDAQFINGLQTIHCLHAHTALLDDQVEVLLKIICSDDEPAISSIVIASNSQNPFGPAELLSQLPFARRLQQHFNAVVGPDDAPYLWLERRKGELSDLRVERGHRVLSLGDLLRGMIAAFRCAPEFAQNAQWEELRGQVPEYLFNDGHDMSIYHTAGLLSWRAREAIAALKSAAVSYPARNHLIFAMRLLAEPPGNLSWPGSEAFPSASFRLAAYVDNMRQVLLSDHSAAAIAEAADRVIREAAAALDREFKARDMRDRTFTRKVDELARLARKR